MGEKRWVEGKGTICCRKLFFGQLPGAHYILYFNWVVVSNILFSPLFGEMIQIVTNIFEMG